MNQSVTKSSVDFEWLFKLRVAIARCGEMDMARWWNSNKQLGSAGASVLKRGFPRTHNFAQARSVIAIAAHRCNQLFPQEDAITLWRLPDDVEQQLESHWDAWIDRADHWSPFFDSVARLDNPDPLFILRVLQLAEPEQVKACGSIRRPSNGCGLMVGKSFSGAPQEIALLALGFGAGALNDTVVPFINGG